MGETFLDRHGIKSGIKLNDVIEEIRYVANGKSVKKGDFLTYIGEDVAPALEPPFNAVALSSGVGAPEYVEEEVEVKKTGDIIPKTWVKVSDYQYIADGVTLSVDSINDATTAWSYYMPYYACDGDGSTYYRGDTSEYNYYRWIKWNFDNPQKITKMHLYIDIDVGNTLATQYGSMTIQGSNNDSEWVDLFSIPITSDRTYNADITLSNTNYYKYYRIYAYTIENDLQINEWYVTEYAVKEIQQIPSTEHNEQVKIARPNVGVI